MHDQQCPAWACQPHLHFLGKDQDSLILIIEDDGKGCVDIQEGFGLHHMKERIALLNGNVRFYGRDGFEVLVELPLRKEDERI